MFSHPHNSTYKYLPIVIFALTSISKATLLLQEVQAIAEFPPACEAAYKTPIQACPSAKDFSLTNTGTTSICSQECSNALARISTSIQRACQGTAAPPGTVIAHAFTGELPYFLCTPSPGSGSGAGSSLASSPSSGSTSLPGQASSSGSSTGSSAISSSPSATSSTTLSNTAANSSSNSASSTSSSISSSTPSSSSTQSSSQTLTTKISTTTSKTSSTETSTRAGQTVTPGGSSPFDQVVPNSAYRTTFSINILTIGVAIASSFILGHRFV